MKTLLVKIAFWILRRYNLQLLPSPPVKVIKIVFPPSWERAKPYIEEASHLICHWDRVTAEGTSGEYKRHQVLAGLIDKFPNASKRDMSLAIEIAMEPR